MVKASSWMSCMWFRIILSEMVSFLCLSWGLQELWAADTLQVQEFMFNFLRDPLREIDEPYFSLDEVRHLE